MKFKESVAKFHFAFFLSCLTIFYATAQVDNDFETNYNLKVLKYLKENISQGDKKNKDYDNSYKLRIGDSAFFFLRIPFIDKPITTDFIVLKTDSFGNCLKGSIIHIVKSKINNPYLDTLIVYNLIRDKKWVVYNTEPKKIKKVEINKTKVLDPVLISSYEGPNLTSVIYLNLFAILNPDSIEFMKDGGGFGVSPCGETSGGFGTYSFYFNVNLNKNNFLTPVADKIEFERPENLSPIDLKKMLR